MTKQDVIISIQNHLKNLNKFAGYKSPKNKKYLNWINEYYKNTEIKHSTHIEKCWVLLHNDNIEHCLMCGKKSIFGNFTQGYRSKRCKKCGSPEGYRKLAQKRKEESPEIIINKICKECDKEFSYKSRKLNNTINRHFCSKSCAGNYNHKHMSKETKTKKSEKTKKTNLKKYGDEYVINSKYTKSITKQKMGVEYPFQDPKIIKKTKNTLFLNTGFYTPCQNPETLKKMLKTKIERYGDFLIPMSKYKNFTMPSGKIVKIQGNENYGLNILLKKYQESDIIIGRKNIENEIGKIYYISTDNKSHIYYPDIYVKSDNKIFEVKSNFTYKIHKEVSELKKQAILQKNIAFEFMIID